MFFSEERKQSVNL